jgi:hypothetical protein
LFHKKVVDRNNACVAFTTAIRRRVTPAAMRFGIGVRAAFVHPNRTT